MHRWMAGTGPAYNNEMSQKLTRRQLAGAVAIAVPALAQQPAANTTPPTASQDLESARERNRNLAKELAAFSIPMSTEPAFQFKA